MHRHFFLCNLYFWVIRKNTKNTRILVYCKIYQMTFISFHLTENSLTKMFLSRCSFKSVRLILLLFKLNRIRVLSRISIRSISFWNLERRRLRSDIFHYEIFHKKASNMGKLSPVSTSCAKFAWRKNYRQKSVCRNI